MISQKTKDAGNLICYLIGGRAGWGGFPILPKFHDSVSHVIFDADPDSIADITRYWRGIGQEALVLPYCLWRANEAVSFKITANPYASSIYSFNPELNDYCSEKSPPDMIFGEMFHVVRTVEVEGRRVDDLLNEDVPGADFLTLDTQGAEMDILAGAAKMLASDVLAIAIEVSFVPVYEKTPLFGDVDKFMREQGFVLADLAMMRAATRRGPVGFRGKGFPFQGEALYLKHIDRLPLAGWTRERHYLGLLKLAFIATVYGHIEFALSALSAIETEQFSDELIANYAHLSYVRLTAELNRLRKEAAFPVTFADLQRRTNGAYPSPNPQRPRIRDLVLRRPSVIWIWLSRAWRSFWRKHMPALPFRLQFARRPNAVERLLRSRGLNEAADMLLANRINYTRDSKKLAQDLIFNG